MHLRTVHQLAVPVFELWVEIKANFQIFTNTDLTRKNLSRGVKFRNLRFFDKLKNLSRGVGKILKSAISDKLEKLVKGGGKISKFSRRRRTLIR